MAALVRQDHATLILDAGKYRNEASKHMHAVAAWDHKDPKEFRAAALEGFKRYGCVTVEHAEAKGIKKTEKGLFEITDGNGKVYSAKKVVLASGVEDIYPEIDGYKECWVSGMYVLCSNISPLASVY